MELPTLTRRAIGEAVKEICSVYRVSTPVGRSFANPPEVTISIIIEQRIIEQIRKVGFPCIMGSTLSREEADVLIQFINYCVPPEASNGE